MSQSCTRYWENQNRARAESRRVLVKKTIARAYDTMWTPTECQVGLSSGAGGLVKSITTAENNRRISDKLRGLFVPQKFIRRYGAKRRDRVPFSMQAVIDQYETASCASESDDEDNGRSG